MFENGGEEIKSKVSLLSVKFIFNNYVLIFFRIFKRACQEKARNHKLI